MSAESIKLAEIFEKSSVVLLDIAGTTTSHSFVKVKTDSIYYEMNNIFSVVILLFNTREISTYIIHRLT